MTAIGQQPEGGASIPNRLSRFKGPLRFRQTTSGGGFAPDSIPSLPRLLIPATYSHHRSKVTDTCNLFQGYAAARVRFVSDKPQPVVALLPIPFHPILDY
ncbi:hypothetical protein L2E82_47788 [Cichorium intybus]|uniref:Uncharacterized protein n=1 Tax=Cichorium intybus TaxID=13427 RepID=A0ACB8YWP6_CICIN|nr:hypothetical protein L2E82_47788 [Cichorium intybus]